MSLGSRLAARGRAVFNANLISTPREPLLFLYPPWSRNVSTESAASAPSTRDVERTITTAPNAFTAKSKYMEERDGGNVLGPLERSAGLSQVSKHNIVQSKLERIYDRNEKALERGLGEMIICEPPHTEKHEPPDSQRDDFEEEPLLGLTSTFNDEKLEGRILRNIFSAEDWAKKTNAGSNTNPDFSESRTLGTIRRVIYSKNKLMEQVPKWRNSRLEYQQERQAAKGNYWIPDWRIILQDLCDHTPPAEKWLEKAITISVPDTAAKYLIHGIDDNIEEIAAQFDCSIWIVSKSHDTTTNEKQFMLSGTKSAITGAVTQIIRIAPDVTLSKDNASVLTPQVAPSATAIYSADGIQLSNRSAARFTLSSRKVIRHVESVEARPQHRVWTKHDFLRYVENLTSSDVPNQVHRRLYGKKRIHSFEVLKTLQDVFRDPRCEQAVTRAAFNKAIRFCLQVWQLRDLRMLFFRMEELKIPMNLETYNLMLHASANKNDLYNFGFILSMMFEQGLVPNSRTWMAFLRAVDHSQVKGKVVLEMRRRGLLRSIKTMKHIAIQLVHLETVHSLRRKVPRSQAQFMTSMDQRYGPDWLTTASGNIILHHLAANGLVSRCWDFLFVMQSREQASPDTRSFNLILNHLKHHRNISGAVDMLANLPASFNFIPNQTTYHILFRMAWSGKCYNLAKVVWRYACLKANTTRDMRARVLKSLNQNSVRAWKDRAKSSDSQKQWNLTAGNFITGTAVLEHHPMLALRSQFVSTYGPHAVKEQFPRSYDALWESPHGGLIPDIRELARLQRGYIVNQLDGSMFEYFEPELPFAAMLREAWELDQKWHALDAAAGNTGHWEAIAKKEPPIVVPVKTFSARMNVLQVDKADNVEKVEEIWSDVPHADLRMTWK